VITNHLITSRPPTLIQSEFRHLHTPFNKHASSPFQQARFFTLLPRIAASSGIYNLNPDIYNLKLYHLQSKTLSSTISTHHTLTQARARSAGQLKLGYYVTKGHHYISLLLGCFIQSLVYLGGFCRWLSSSSRW